MDNNEYGNVRALLNRSRKAHKFGPNDRMQLVMRFDSLWAFMLAEGTEEQQEDFKKRYNKFCEFYSFPKPEYVGKIDEDTEKEIEEAIENTLKEQDEENAEES